MMQVGLQSTSNNMPGSRWPTLRSTPDAATMRIHTQAQSSESPYQAPMSVPTTSSISRRKPKMTFRSPDASTPLALKLSALTGPSADETKQTGWNSSQSSASSSTSSNAPSPSANGTARAACSFFTPCPPLFKMPLAYPSYHPFSSGQLLLAATARADAAAARRRATDNGGTERDDTSAQGDDAASNGVGRQDPEGDARRSSSRTRRPVAKLRDIIDGEESKEPDSAPKEDEANDAKSPKRKRAGGNGGSRKKRKEASSAPVEAQPRRERQRRGAAAAAAAAMAENAEAVAAILDGDSESMEAVETVETPASMDIPAAPGSPEEDNNESEVVAPKSAAKNARPKRQARPKRSRNTSAVNANKDETKEVTPTRTTRQSRRRGSSMSGSDGTGESASALVVEAVPAKESPDEEEPAAAPVEAPTVIDDFSANIDPALLAEDASTAASTGSAGLGPRSASA